MREEIELMRIVRVPPMGRLVVQAASNRYENLSEIEDDRLKRQVITAIGELIGFVGGYQALVDEGVAPPLSAQTPSGGLQSKAAALKEQQDRFLATLQNEKERMAQANQSRRVPEVDVTQPTPEQEPASIVEQIDLILQRYLSQSEAYNGRSIHLVQGPEGNVKIQVDGQVFDRPRDIEEKPIQVMIKRALKEWEAT